MSFESSAPDAAVENTGDHNAVPEILKTRAAKKEKSESLPPVAGTNEVLVWSAFAVLLAILLAGYWNMMVVAYHHWQGELYSHGYLIPGIAVVLLWLRRQPVPDVPVRQRWVGVVVLALSQVARVFVAQYETIDMWTFIPAFLGIIIIVGGYSMLRWAGPVAALLFFMFPLPWTIEQQLLPPLQTLATSASTTALNILGIFARQEGNNIHLAQSTIGVVEQCSGLRMTTILLALSVALVLLNERQVWENVVILGMALPIALLTNIIRITSTGIVIAIYPNNPSLEHIVHDVAGFCMVPIAIGFLVGLQAIMSHIFIDSAVDYTAGNDVMETPKDVFWRDRRQIDD